VSTLRQSAGSMTPMLHGLGDAKQGVSSEEAVMGEAFLFRQYAKEAMHVASEVTSENEKRNLVDVAYTWALAALMSDRVLGSSFVSSLCDVGEAASHPPS